MRVHTHIPQLIDQIIFIEMRETFESLLEEITLSDQGRSAALVHIEQYPDLGKNIARARSNEFCARNTQSKASQTRFLDWWTNEQNTQIECFFWGSLDTTSLLVLKLLREHFTNMQAWQLGYKALLEVHANGAGRLINNTGQLLAELPAATGCHYTDTILIPLLRHSRRSIRQTEVKPTGLLI